MQRILNLVRYEFTCPSSPERWRVASISVSTGINRCYSARIGLVCDNRSADISKLLGTRGKLRINRNLKEVFFCGLISQVSNIGREGMLTRAEIDLVPAMSLLSKRMDSRIFQNQSALDIIRTIFNETIHPAGASFNIDAPTRGKEVREYCVQYHETDADFVDRLLAEEGINYYFDYDKSKDCERIVLFDEIRQLPDAKSIAGSDYFVIGKQAAHNNTKECIDEFQVSERIVTNRVAGAAWDWRHDAVSKFDRSAESPLPPLEVFQPYQRRQDTKQLSTRIEDELASIQQDKRVGRGTSETVSFFAGARMQVKYSSLREHDGYYIITNLEHFGSCPDLLYGLDSGKTGERPDMGPQYQNRFDCIPAQGQIRPGPRRSKPLISGAQTARVCGPKEGEVHVDKHGRILVRFSWDRGNNNVARDSCWVRVAQSWAGSSWGAQFIPRVGMEAVVEFLDGDPDRPIVTGTVYNGTHGVPFKLPGKLTQSGFRTRSSRGSEGFHELRFDDQKDREEIYLKSQKDWNIEVLDKKSETVQGEVQETYNRSQTAEIAENKTTTVGKDHALAVVGSQRIDIEKNQETLVQGSQSTRVDGEVATEHAKSLEHVVGKDLKQQVKGDIDVQCSGAESRSLQKGLTLSSAAGGVEIDLAKSFDLSAMKIKLVCGAASIEISPAEIKINGGASVVSVQGAMVKIN